MDSMALQGNQSPDGDATTMLLFLDTLLHGTASFNTDEIFFTQPVSIELVRVVKCESNPHPNLKHLQR